MVEEPSLFHSFIQHLLLITDVQESSSIHQRQHEGAYNNSLICLRNLERDRHNLSSKSILTVLNIVSLGPPARCRIGSIPAPHPFERLMITIEQYSQ